MAVLKLLKGGTTGQVLPLSGERTLIGRHPTCHVVLDNAAISRHHAQILESHGTFYLEDLRSRNGTHLNDAPVRGRIELQDGDEVKLCDFVFQFFATSDSSVPGTPSTRLTGVPRSFGRSRETIDADEDDEPALPPARGTSGSVGKVIEPVPADAAAMDGSSIIGSVDHDPTGTVRLHVRPEVKLRAILEISAALGRVVKIEDVLPQILSALFRIFPQADYGFVLLRDPSTQKLVVRASRSRRANDDEEVPVSQTIVQQAMETGKALLSADATRDRRFDSSESLAELEIRSVMCAPLLLVGTAPLGVIQISTRDLNQQFANEDLDLLASVSSQCALAVQNAQLHESLLAQRDIERELEFATQVQLGFLPSEPPSAPSYEFADYYEPAHRVGGDYFDYIRLPNGNVAVTVGDVAGKGVPAALLMARLHASARYHLLSATSAAEAMTSLNAEIATSGLGFRFITLVMAILNPRTHEIRIANAGHLPPLLRQAPHGSQQTGSISWIGIKESGMPLGVSPTQSFQELPLALSPGDTLVFYTDGVTEAMNDCQEIYGRERLGQVVHAGPPEAGGLVPFVVDHVEAFFGELAQRDDLCVVAVRRLPEITPPTAPPPRDASGAA